MALILTKKVIYTNLYVFVCIFRVILSQNILPICFSIPGAGAFSVTVARSQAEKKVTEQSRDICAHGSYQPGRRHWIPVLVSKGVRGLRPFPQDFDIPSSTGPVQ
jgi:hypothetical protein